MYVVVGRHVPVLTMHDITYSSRSPHAIPDLQHITYSSRSPHAYLIYNTYRIVPVLPMPT